MATAEAWGWGQVGCAYKQSHTGRWRQHRARPGGRKHLVPRQTSSGRGWTCPRGRKVGPGTQGLLAQGVCGLSTEP